jgi:ABC-type glycerol-3-phosphate transport system permease component
MHLALVLHISAVHPLVYLFFAQRFFVRGIVLSGIRR